MAIHATFLSILLMSQIILPPFSETSHRLKWLVPSLIKNKPLIYYKYYQAVKFSEIWFNIFCHCSVIYYRNDIMQLHLLPSTAFKPIFDILYNINNVYLENTMTETQFSWTAMPKGGIWLLKATQSELPVISILASFEHIYTSWLCRRLKSGYSAFFPSMLHARPSLRASFRLSSHVPRSALVSAAKRYLVKQVLVYNLFAFVYLICSFFLSLLLVQ